MAESQIQSEASGQRTDAMARELFNALGTERQIVPFSSRFPDFSLGEAYDVSTRPCAMREARGEKPVGRKIGFTNQAVWGAGGIAAPIWGFMYDRTVHDLAATGETFALASLPSLRWCSISHRRRPPI